MLAYESIFRLSVFFAVLFIMAALEFFIPRRPQSLGRTSRWPSNIGISLMNIVVLKLILPFTAISTAFFATSQGYGLFNWLLLPFWLAIFLSIILLDMIIYGQHVLFHKVHFFWRFHRMHHADTEIDVTTGIRFHPIEALMSMILKCGFVIALGAPPLAVVLFEVILNASSMFSHSNVKLPFDHILRKIIVTPDMHRVHHSVIRSETDSNYGFNLSIWDRLFHTYQPQPQKGHDDMQIGIEKFRPVSEARLDKMLTQPFREK